MKIGLYGGSFDPIHYGHLRPLRQARRVLGLDRVLYLPTARPPHKGKPLAPALRRFAMVELALLGEPGMSVSTLEMREDRPSYTIDTLERLRRREPGARLVLLLGGDSFLQLTAWRRWRQILEIAELGVLGRPGWELDPERLVPELRHALAGGRVRLVANTPVDASSTAVRQALAAGASDLEDLMPPTVLDYVAKYRLYDHDRGKKKSR